MDIDLSQFMLCKSNADLTKYGKRLIEENPEDNSHLIAVSKYYFHPSSLENVWVVERIHEYCNDPHENKDYIYYLLENLYDVSEMMVLWYGDDYMDLDILESKEGLINFIKDSLMVSPVELYVLTKRYIQLKDEYRKP